ncbi:MAG: acetyl-CoA decarbonylase/synthase complex subunit alpha/beta [Bacillota bacterium]
MCRQIATLARSGAEQIVADAGQALAEAVRVYGPNAAVGFPNTGYFLPIIYGTTGLKVERLEDAVTALARAREFMATTESPPDLQDALAAGMAALFAGEVTEAARYLRQPGYYGRPAPDTGVTWLGAADDAVLRQLGIQFVDGRAPGFAICVGAAPDEETALRLIRELQESDLYVFMAGSSAGGVSLAEQLAARGVQLGWETRLVPLGKEVTAAVFAVGFAVRVALSFGALNPGNMKQLVSYVKERVHAFVLALGESDARTIAQAAGALNFGVPTIATATVPEILMPGICAYESVVGGISYDRLVRRALEVRGLKIKPRKVSLPVAFGPAFEGESVRRADVQAEFGGQRTPAFELLRAVSKDEVADGRITLFGPDIDAITPGGHLPLGIVVDVYGRRMHEDFEPVLERRLHHYINYAQGVWHIGQRDLNWLRISRNAFSQGFRLRHLGEIICASLKEEFANIVDRVQVELYTREEDVLRLREAARAEYARRDLRLADLRDENVDFFYSCTLCQTFAPSHVCLVLPERTGLCGAVSWLDARAAYEINPHGSNRPVPKKGLINARRGEWASCNAFVYEHSRGAVARVCLYSVMDAPHTSCGCFEAIVSLLPECNGFLVVNREYNGMTPAGMTFSTLAGSIGGGIQTPGFMGVAKAFLGSRKFLQAEGGMARVVWMPADLKEQMHQALGRAAIAAGLGEGFLNKIADERVGTTVDEILPFLEKVAHPALTMEPLL